MAKRGRINALDQLAASVLAGETTEFPWEILRSTYFTAKWDRAAARHLAQWAEKHGIGVAIEGHNAGSDTWIRFSVPDQRSP
jgi:hypothetical protein